jgi:hypothetical protein
MYFLLEEGSRLVDAAASLRYSLNLLGQRCYHPPQFNLAILVLYSTIGIYIQTPES